MAPATFNEEETELLIELVRKYPVLYNLKDKSYFNNNIKENAWKKVAEVLNKNVAECKTRWKTVRDSYRKNNRKLGSGSAATIKSKYSSDKLSFLNTVETYRPTKSNIINEQLSQKTTTSDDSEGNTHEESQEENEELQAVTEERGEIVQEDSRQTDEKIKKNMEPVTKKRKSDGLIEEMRKSRIQREQIMEKIIHKQETSKNDPVDIFFQGIAATVKNLPAQLIVEAKLAVSKVIADFELRAINQQSIRQEFYMPDYLLSPSTSSSIHSHCGVDETEYIQL